MILFIKPLSARHVYAIKKIVLKTRTVPLKPGTDDSRDTRGTGSYNIKAQHETYLEVHSFCFKFLKYYFARDCSRLWPALKIPVDFRYTLYKTGGWK